MSGWKIPAFAALIVSGVIPAHCEVRSGSRRSGGRWGLHLPRKPALLYWALYLGACLLRMR